MPNFGLSRDIDPNNMNPNFEVCNIWYIPQLMFTATSFPVVVGLFFVPGRCVCCVL